MCSGYHLILTFAILLIIPLPTLFHFQKALEFAKANYSPDSSDIRLHPLNILVHSNKPTDARGILYSSKIPIDDRAQTVKFGLDNISNNWEVILKEYKAYEASHKILPAWEFPWHKTVWVKFFDLPTGSDSFFPETLKLLNEAGIVSGYFAKVLPNSAFYPHIGYIAGIWRYHLTLVAPEIKNHIPPTIIHSPETLLSPLHLGVQRTPNLEPLDKRRHYSRGRSIYEHLPNAIIALSNSNMIRFAYCNPTGLYDPDLDQYYRMNEGMEDTEREKASLRVREDIKEGWMYHEYESGNFCLFDDNNIHYVQNESEEERVVLLLDLPRADLPLHISLINKLALCIFARVIPEISESGRGILKHYELTERGLGGDITTMDLLSTSLQFEDSDIREL